MDPVQPGLQLVAGELEEGAGEEDGDNEQQRAGHQFQAETVEPNIQLVHPQRLCHRTELKKEKSKKFLDIFKLKICSKDLY